MGNPLVGKRISFTYETGAPGAAIEITALRQTENLKESRSGRSVGSTDNYDMAVIAPNIYMASWSGNDGHVVTAVFNLNDMTINSTYSDTERARFPMAGIINELR